MRWNIESNYEFIKRIDRLSRWHRWFAWYPVSVNVAYNKKQMVWLDYVHRRADLLKWEYKLLDNGS